MAQRILVLGGDGYLGWPTAMAFSRAGHRVAVVDNFAKRQWELELGVRPLFPVPTLHERVRAWREVTENDIELHVGDLTDYAFVECVIDGFRPDTIVHYGEQPSAPYSMIDVRPRDVHPGEQRHRQPQRPVRDPRPLARTPTSSSWGRWASTGRPTSTSRRATSPSPTRAGQHTFLYPKTPGSMYHLSKVHDSHNIHFATRIWGLRATDLNQGVVYGVETDESALDPRLATSFHYDEVFGTALNRFCVQAVIGYPLTVYGKGGQTRGYLNIRDTIQCVSLAAANPAGPGELRVYNQFTEQFSVLELAERVKSAGEHLGWDVAIEHTPNPRKEMEAALLQRAALEAARPRPAAAAAQRGADRHDARPDRATIATGSTRRRFVQNVRWVPDSLAACPRSGRSGAEPNRPRHRRGRVHRLDPGPAARRARRPRPHPRRPLRRQPGLPRGRSPMSTDRGVPGRRAAVVERAVDGVDAVVHLAARAGIPDSVTRPARDVRCERVPDGRPARRRRGWRGSGGSCSPPRMPRPATTRRRPTRRTCPTRLAVRRIEARRRGVLPGLRGDVRAGGLRSSASRTRTARTRSTRRASSPRGSGQRSPASRSRSTATASRRATSCTCGTSRAAVVACLDAPEAAVAGEMFQAGTGRETTVNALAAADRGGRRTAARDPPWTGARRRHRAQRQPGRQGGDGTRLPGGGRPRRRARRRPRAGMIDALARPELAGIAPHAASGSD